jgi:hypothetical protein
LRAGRRQGKTARLCHYGRASRRVVPAVKAVASAAGRMTVIVWKVGGGSSRGAGSGRGGAAQAALWSANKLSGGSASSGVNSSAVGTEDRVRLAHIDVDVRVVLRRRLPHALEFPHSDADFGDAAVVSEFQTIAGPRYSTAKSKAVQPRLLGEFWELKSTSPITY